jgi:dolichyl-phosphate-mannose-protein mannosyltransferase
VLALTARKLPAAAICFAIAVLIKPQSLVFAPLLLFALIERKSWKLWLYSLLYGLAAFVLLLIPFSLYRNPWWIVDQYRSMLGMYPYASLNAFNLYALLGANGLPDSTKWLDISYKHWDILVIIIVLVLSAFLFSQSKDKFKYAYLGMLIIILVFMFKTGMHERYDYPALVLAVLGFLQRKDNRILYLFAGLSLAHFANVAYVLRWSLNGKYLIASHDEILLLVSLANLIIAGYAVKLAFEFLLHRKRQAVFPNVPL